MEQYTASLLLSVSLCRWLVAEVADGLVAELTFGHGVNLVFWPAIVSGSLALLVKYLAVLRVVPVCKILTGCLGVLLVSWYIDRTLKHNVYLMVRAVGVALVLGAVLGLFMVSEEGVPKHQARAAAPSAPEQVAQAEYLSHRD